VAIAKKYRRKIVVDGLTYFWVVKDHVDTLTLVVELESGGAKLNIDFDPVHAFYNCAKLSIRPAFVRGAILDARAGGWKPEQPGPLFWGVTGNFRLASETEGGIKTFTWSQAPERTGSELIERK
jgi:hypothetical protein